ncbi:MAG: hypothetical protein K8823_105 [Cenarchaeum symbiont of Oopsacas minuta]|nr:hypothetical protein [Cenarchaeum symbiont of Oopsacas minuta]
MSKSNILEVMLSYGKGVFSMDEKIPITVSFSVQGGIRDDFNEKNWTKAYDKNENTLKIKYGIKVRSGGIKKHVLGKVDTYRKASIFWTRNPKLTNPMKEKRVWVQVAKNFMPYIKLSEEEVQQELFDFDEIIHVNASDLGVGEHQISAETFVSWNKHDYTDSDKVECSSKNYKITITT